MAETTTIAVLAKAPVAGLAKTRLVASLGADGAAALAARLIERAAAAACAAAPGRVTLWTAPDETHPVFQAMRAKFGVPLARQPDGDLGLRMHQAIAAAGGPALVIGADCPALTAERLRAAAQALRSHDAVAIPAEDGGYVLIGLRRTAPALFCDMQWSVPTVMAETRRRLSTLGLSFREFDPLWDVDTPADLARLRREHPGLCEPQQD
jgi:rSAM/selenodomain-associated transferase 1